MNWLKVAKDSQSMYRDSGYPMDDESTGSGDMPFGRKRETKESFFNCADDYYALRQPRFSLPEQIHSPDYKKYIKGMFHNEPCLFGHRIFSRSAAIYAAVRGLPPPVLDPDFPTATSIPNTVDPALPVPTPVPAVSETPVTTSRTSRNRSTTSATNGGNDEFEFESRAEKRLSFSLVFQTLKFEKYLHDMLKSSKFYDNYPEFAELMAFVMIILCDFTTRKFQRRLPRSMKPIISPQLAQRLADINLINLPTSINQKSSSQPPAFKPPQPTLDDGNIPLLADIEDCLYRSRVKLSAAHARSRIRARVLSIESLLPSNVRHNDELASKMNVCCWVNFCKTSMAALTSLLEQCGHFLVKSGEDLTGMAYMFDEHCNDLIYFPSDLLDYIELHPLVDKRYIVIQDKSSSLGVHSIRRMMSDGDDVIHVNVGSGITTAHLASLTHGTETKIFAFGIHSDRQHKEIIRNLDKFGCRSSVKLISDNFVDIDIYDDRFKDIKLILVSAECSRSGVTNAVNFIVSEGEDYEFTSYREVGISNTKGTSIYGYQASSMRARVLRVRSPTVPERSEWNLFPNQFTIVDVTILRDLSAGRTNPGKLKELVTKETSILKHALRLPRVQGVVYCTWSLIEDENEQVAGNCVDQNNAAQQTKTPFRHGPPVIPLSEADIDNESGPLVGKFMKFMPSVFNCGCFIATITREADDPKEAAKGILARAAARGIIGGISSLPQTSSSQTASRSKMTSNTRSKGAGGKTLGRKKSVLISSASVTNLHSAMLSRDPNDTSADVLEVNEPDEHMTSVDEGAPPETM